MVTKFDDKISEAKKKLKELQDSKRKAESAAKQREAKQKRNDDTRRKILLGSFYLAQMESNPDLKEQIVKKLDAFLSRDKDRILFGLSPKKVEQKSTTD